MGFSIVTELSKHHYNLTSKHSHHPQKKAHVHPSSSPNSRQPLIYFLPTWICLFWTFLINGTISTQQMAFCVWLLLLTKLFFKSHPCCNINQYFIFLLMNNTPLYGYFTFCLSIHQLMDIWGFPPLSSSYE